MSSHRGLGAYGNVFAIESFMDELAIATGSDPAEYRVRHLKDPRARDAIRAAADRFGWSTWKRTPGRGRGIAFARYKNIAGYCAVALEVEVDSRSGSIRVLRAVASADSGHIVSPDGVSNQIEGGLVQSLSWTLKEEVQMDDTRILSEDWASYPILTFSEVPPVDVVLIDRPGQPFLGTGEALILIGESTLGLFLFVGKVFDGGHELGDVTRLVDLPLKFFDHLCHTFEVDFDLGQLLLLLLSLGGGVSDLRFDFFDLLGRFRKITRVLGLGLLGGFFMLLHGDEILLRILLASTLVLQTFLIFPGKKGRACEADGSESR
jgi:hypothetical protein